MFVGGGGLEGEIVGGGRGEGKGVGNRHFKETAKFEIQI